MGTTETTMQTRTKMSTSMADLRSVSRINPDDFNSFHLCFVLDKLLKLIETPIINPIVHSLSSVLSANPLEVFHNNFVSIEFGNNVFAYIMVNPSHPTSFSSRELFEKPLAGTSAFSLEFISKISKFSFNLFNLCRVVKAIVGSDCKIVYSEINTKNKLRSNVVSIDFFRECKKEETSVLFIYTKEAFTEFPVAEILLITERNNYIKRLSYFKQSQDKSVLFKISISREVELDRSFANDRFSFGFFDNSTGLFDAGDCKLGRQFPSQGFIDKRMQFNIVFDFMFPCLIDTELQGFGISIDSSKNFRSCSDFDFSSDITSHGLIDTNEVYIPTQKERGIPLQPNCIAVEDVVSCLRR